MIFYEPVMFPANIENGAGLCTVKYLAGIFYHTLFQRAITALGILKVEAGRYPESHKGGL